MKNIKFQLDVIMKKIGWNFFPSKLTDPLNFSLELLRGPRLQVKRL